MSRRGSKVQEITLEFENMKPDYTPYATPLTKEAEEYLPLLKEPDRIVIKGTEPVYVVWQECTKWTRWQVDCPKGAEGMSVKALVARIVQVSWKRARRFVCPSLLYMH